MVEMSGLSQSKAVYQRAYSKINLTIEVFNKRPDGYHEVSMLMQSVRLWDDVRIVAAQTPEIHVSCNVPFLKADEKNIAYRAAKLMQDRFSIPQGVLIELGKQIPIAAGLAGGSADAAAVIRGMNRLFRLNLSAAKMMQIGEEIGSDVPFCVIGGTCLATGRGEKVQRVKPMPDAHIVLVKPNFGISTPWAYEHFDQGAVTKRPDEGKMLAAIERRDLAAVGQELVNMLEPAAIQEYPIIAQIKDDLLHMGAAGAAMSGSGPTVFGLFSRYDQARAAVRFCKGKYPWRFQVMCCRVYSPAGRRRYGKGQSSQRGDTL